MPGLFSNQKYPDKYQEEALTLLKEILGSLKNIDSGIQKMQGLQADMVSEPAATPNTIQIIADLDSQGDQDELINQIAQLQAELKEQVYLCEEQKAELYEAREDLQSAQNRKEELKKELVRKREELDSCLMDLADAKAQLAQKENELQGGEKDQALAAFYASLEQKDRELEHKENKIKECKAALEQQAKELQDLSAALEQQGKELQNVSAALAETRMYLDVKDRELDSCRVELAASAAKNEQLRESLLPEQDDLLQIWRKLQNLPEPVKEIASLYYNPNVLSVFLTQCGQFALLRECWQSCVKKALNGSRTEGMADFLELVLQIYNKAFADNPCQIITAEPASAFDITNHDRMGPMGNAVSKMVLPGLIKPNGEIACKCLVQLA